MHSPFLQLVRSSREFGFLSISKSAYIAFCDIQFICKYTGTSGQRFQNLYVILKKRASITKYNGKERKKVYNLIIFPTLLGRLQPTNCIYFVNFCAIWTLNGSERNKSEFNTNSNTVILDSYKHTNNKEMENHHIKPEKMLFTYLFINIY